MKFWMKDQEMDQEIRVEYMVNVCDEDLLGKQINENVKISEHFYKGELVDEERVLEELNKATLINLFGNNIVDFAIEKGFIQEDNVKTINNIKHVIVIVS